MAHHKVEDLEITINRREAKLVTNDGNMAFFKSHVLLDLDLLLVPDRNFFPLQEVFIVICIIRVT